MSDQMPENYGQGDSGPDDSNSSSEGSFENGSESTAGESAGGQTGFNPSWNEAFDQIPIPEYHEKLKPVFEKWERNNNQRYEQVQQEYAPYKILTENQVSIDEVKQAFELRNQISQSPEQVFQKLAQVLGYDLSQFESNGDESQGLTDEYPGEVEDPRIAQLTKQNENILSYLQEQAAQEESIRLAEETKQQESTWFEETKSGLDSLEQKYGQLDRNRVVQFALWESEKSGGEFNLESGVRAMQEFAQSAIKNSANSQAPQVFSGNGSLVSGRVDTSKMSDSEFQRYAVERIRAKNGG